MGKLVRIGILLLALTFGVLFGTWYLGSYVDFRMYMGNTDLEVRTEAEIREAIGSPDGVRAVNTVTLFGHFPFRLEGTMWGTAIVAFWAVLFWLAAGFVLNRLAQRWAV